MKKYLTGSTATGCSMPGPKIRVFLKSTDLIEVFTLFAAIVSHLMELFAANAKIAASTNAKFFIMIAHITIT